MAKVFKRAPDSYTRLPDPVLCYIEDAAIALSKNNNKSIASNKEIVKKLLLKSNIQNPEVTFRETQSNGDRIVTTDTLRNVIQHIRTSAVVTAPSFTSYKHPHVMKSFQAGFLDNNIMLRKKEKKKAFLAKQQEQPDKYVYHNTLQKTRKIFNNSLSGSYVSKSTILYSPSAHYTLTSITRKVAGIGNAISESVIAGNRLYKDPESVVNHILTLCRFTTQEVKDAVDTYNLHIPTTDEIINVLKMSSDNYFIDDTMYEVIRTIIDNSSKYEKCNMVYNNNMWHLKEYNPELVKKFIIDMITDNILPVSEIGDVDDVINTADEGVLNLLYHLHVDMLRGADRATWTDAIKLTLASGIINIEKCLIKYTGLLAPFLVTDVLPPNIAYLKDMYRDCIVLSDTDSTCGAYDEWSTWFFGEPRFDALATKVTAVIMTINTQIIDHYIKIYTGNMNVAKEHRNTLAMKNEFYWSSFNVANVSKHYFAQVIIQEGNVLPKPDLELKGVHLIASKAPAQIREVGMEMIKEIQTSINNNTKISLTSFATKVADIERGLISDITNGDINVFDMEKIKEKEAYKNEASVSPYLHHLLWKEVFSEKYGDSDIPQYMVLKIPTLNTNKRKMDEYVSSLEDVDLANRLTKFMLKYKKEQITTFKVPLTIAADNGIPKEMLQNININRLITTGCNMLYMILETIGFYRKKDLLVCEMGY